MKRCILCKRSLFVNVTYVGRNEIYECPTCELAVTSKVTGTKKKLYGTSKFYSPLAAKANIDKYVAKYERVIERMSMFVGNGKVLDVGGGFGLFSALLSKEKSFKVTVLEPNLKPFFIEKFKGVKWIKRAFSKFRGRRRMYSAITFLDVLEHFKDPVMALHKSRELLKFNGYVVILVPNYKSTMRALSRSWPWWMVEDHHFHFSRISLKRILAQTGFRLRYLESFEDRTDFWLSLQGNYGKVKPHYLRKMIKILTLPLIFVIYLVLRPLLWKLYNGGLLLAIAQKK